MGSKQVIIIVVLAIIASANSLKCYQCKGKESDCKDAAEVVCEDLQYTGLFPNGFQPDASISPVKDAKNEKVYACINSNIGDAFYRSCASGLQAALDVTCSTMSLLPSSSCETCKTDLCNSSYLYLPSSILLAAAFIMNFFKQ